MVSPVSSTANRPDQVSDALRAASQQTGVSFDYLLQTAKSESSLDPNAKAPTSSASGLFQFIEQTWLSIVKETGAKFGFGREAAAIDRQTDGRLTVSDKDERKRILSLRNDPNASALFGAAFTQRNVEQLSQDLGRSPDAGETYLAHVLGANGAGRFLTLASQTPNAAAAASFPDAAGANPGIFYGAGGQPRSFAEVQQRLTRSHVAASNPVIALQEAAQATAPVQQAVGRDDNNGVFLSLYQADGRGPVSKLVQSLWGQGGGGPIVSRPRANAASQSAAIRPSFFPSVRDRSIVQPAANSNSPQEAASPTADASGQPAAQANPAAASSPASPKPGAPLDLLYFLRFRG